MRKYRLERPVFERQIQRYDSRKSLSCVCDMGKVRGFLEMRDRGARYSIVVFSRRGIFIGRSVQREIGGILVKAE